MELRRQEQGMALLAVVAVLIALVLIGTPFALQMQSASKRSENLLFTERSQQEADAIYAISNLYLLQGTDANEWKNAAEKKEAFATPDYDTLDEFQIPESVLAEFNSNSALGTIWDVRVEDEQAKVNVSSAPFTMMANLLGATTLSRDIEPDDTTIELTDGTMFPRGGGMVRIGSELIRYGESDGSTLRNVDRGVNADRPMNSEADKWETGEMVMVASAFEIATFPIRIEEGRYHPYSNPYQVRRIAELGSVNLDPDKFDRILERISCYSGREVAGGWCNSQRLKANLPSGGEETSGDSLVVENPRYFNRGTLVKISDGTNVDYGVVMEHSGGRIRLGSVVKHEYEADRAWVQTMARHPVNINTASDDVLVACMSNLSHIGTDDSVSPEVAAGLLAYIHEEPVKSLRQWKEILEKAEADGVITRHDRSVLYINALNPQDARLDFSTIPFCFKSYDVYTVKATAVVNSKSGQEVARKSIRRVVSVSSRKSAVWSLDTQLDFENQIIAARTGKYMMSFPYNTGGFYETWRGVPNVPPSRLVPHLSFNVWPSTGQQSGVGDVRLSPERLGLDRVYHYDDSQHSDGYYVKDGPLYYSTRDNRVDILDDDGMKPMAVGFWLKPFWGGGGGTRYMFDSGEDDFTNRTVVFYDGDQREVVFRVADATLEDRSVEIRYPTDSGQLQEETWYHVAANATGSKPDNLSLMIDGRAVGDASYMTKLTSGISDGTDVTELYVENAESFPETGAVMLFGADGAEIMEYDGRSATSLSLTKRYARVNLQYTNSDEFTGIQHDAGATVVLLGYTQPLVTDIPVGGSTLGEALGEWHAMRVTYGEDIFYIGDTSGGGGGGDTGGGATGGGALGGEPPPGITIQTVPPDTGGGDTGGGDTGGGAPSENTELRGIASDRMQVQLQLGTGIVAWNPDMDDQEALDAFSEEGYALLVSPGPYENLVQGEVVGGWEIVSYIKDSQGLSINRYQETAQTEAAEAHIVPQHSFGSPDAPVTITVGDTSWDGFATALIPISVAASTSNAGDYFDVLENEELQVPELSLTSAYCQIGTEWFQYTYPDLENFGGKTVFVWDRESELAGTVALFEGGTVTVVGGGADNSNPPTDEPPDDGSGDDDPPPPEPGGPGDDDPPPGDDDGGPGDGQPPEPDEPPPGDDGGPSDGEPPLPPEPDDGDDGGPSTGEPPLPPEPGDGDDGGPSTGEPPLPPEPGDGDDGGPGTGEPPLPPDPGEEPPPGGDTGGGEEPPPSEEPPDPTDDGGGGNDPGGSGNSGGAVGEDVPFLEEEIADRLQHRPNGSIMIADTVPEVHDSGDEVRPAFMCTEYNLEYAGYDDRVTIATEEGPDAEYRIQHSFRHVAAGTRWVALTSFVSSHYEYSEGSRQSIYAGTIETRSVLRLLKFPSGEFPTGLGDDIVFCGRYDDSGLSPSMLDELYFKNNNNPRIYRLGDGKAFEADSNASMEILDADATEIYIHNPNSRSNPDGLPVTGLPTDGGVVRIEGELIAYAELDTGTGVLSGCERGVLGSESGIHGYNCRVSEVDWVTVAVLDGSVADTASEISLNRSTGFPRTGGYVRINDEVLGYTRVQGNSLVMPQDLREREDSLYGPPSDEESGSDVGPGIFRGRFGTAANGHESGNFVYLLHSRYPDRFRDRSVDPGLSSIVLQKRVDGAIWKRVAWDERVPDNMDVVVLVRFDGTPEWDSDRIYNVSEQRVQSLGDGRDEPAFRQNPKSFLFQIDTSDGENRILPQGGIQADRVEIRVMFQYKDGAYTPYYGQVPANSWKDTPWLKSLRVEYVAPETVHYSEEVR